MQRHTLSIERLTADTSRITVDQTQEVIYEGSADIDLLADAVREYRGRQRLTFGDALEALKDGRRVARAGWNGKGMFLRMIWPPEGEVFVSQDGARHPVQPCIGMKTADNLMQPGWLASQADMLAEDWMILPRNP